ncbi:hypothetical protein RJ639_000205 [Escallonia herrerae]|uniref:Nop domain-containing protein n=1 Tax=Escallonia herrerae TaxID=1293975 RepID=A0AA89BSN5_9ASTE|nr:hypothetical protein RJ639_000205 [Escallonia herrerae]
MGQDLSPVDFIILKQIAETVIKAAELRKRHNDYLVSKMNDVAPNLAALIGEVIGARLISQAGSLTNLAMSPSSTIQILGAEKALFRTLSKYNLFILWLQGTENPREYTEVWSYIQYFIYWPGICKKQRSNGTLSRKQVLHCCSRRLFPRQVSDCLKRKSFLMIVCALSIFFFLFQLNSDLSLVTTEESTTAFGEKLREQVEERLEFYEKGVAPSKNIDVMKAAIKSFINKGPEVRKIKKIKFNVAAAADGETMAEDKQVAATNGDAPEKKKKKEKRKLHQDAEAGLDRANNKKKKKSKA